MTFIELTTRRDFSFVEVVLGLSQLVFWVVGYGCVLSKLNSCLCTQLDKICVDVMEK